MLPPANPPARPRRTTEGERSRSHKASPYSKSVPPQRRSRARSRTPPPISRRDARSDRSSTAAAALATPATSATTASSQRPRSNRSPLPRSRSSAPSAPAPKTTGAYPVAESSSRSTQLRSNPQAYPPLILLPNPQSDPWRRELQVLASQHVRDGIPVNQEQLDYVAATLNAAGIPSQHSTLAYAKVNSDHHYSKITSPHWFMLTVPNLGAGSKNRRRRDPCCSGLTLPVLAVLEAYCEAGRSILPGSTARSAQPFTPKDGRSQDTPTLTLKK